MREIKESYNRTKFSLNKLSCVVFFDSRSTVASYSNAMKVTLYASRDETFILPEFPIPHRSAFALNA